MKIAIIYYSTYGHVGKLSATALEALKEANVEADLFQVPETLPQEVLDKMYAPPKDDSIPIITVEDLTKYDGFLFGLPTRFGNLPAQFKSFWDQTGGLWANGALNGKPFGIFVSTGTPGGGQEATFRNSLSSFIHHGMIYVPLGYGEAFPLLTNLEEVHGGSPWGAGAYAGADGSRQPSELELKLVQIQAKNFASVVEKFTSTKPAEVPAEKKVSEKVAEKEPEKVEQSTARQAQQKPAVKEDDSFCSKCIIM
ncbi:flavoprotein-like protein Ycp4p [[Candida] jaroonii]|uniref:Flavoprotein-like protein Ycp4p n=1 Tax=[Candida] jaroonii TaxID=467808 RepID=A0ACA9Y5T8_9ASCO|nr:flavoprotein-like protein Ycp4p [[Candida] jaroonii]